ncbi:protein-export chaperone SecB [Sphingomonas lutea]|uniref:Protein-export protein SecB n=1 Tax=Sphingomonas lutea TaxID=1045317 RepID=A0A7G9SG30_9SPHN|nr:protein-export chaperone SecB [Sphingomonas lutea]QNN66805.1 protein-export chaperone SecB [Sphingomonas lutea]
MADQDSPTGGNGAAEPGNEPRVTVHAQYIKDLSVENPNSPQVYQWQVQPSLDVQFNINVDNLSPELHEITLKIDVKARSENGVHFVVDLSYGGLFEIQGVPEEAIPPLLLIEAPRLIFPFARQVIADAVVNTGFPPLLLDPIDFAGAYMAQLQAQQQQLQAGGENPGGAAPVGGLPPQEEPQPQ